MPDAITLPGRPELVGMVRQFVARVLTKALVPSAVIDDALLIASEYATNAVRHSASRDGGDIRLVTDHQAGWARIELHDAGPAATPFVVPKGESDEYGRGLLVVDELATKWGHDRTPDGGVHWAELEWESTDGQP
jgi:serine/threonine-protein kinase RsbW